MAILGNTRICPFKEDSRLIKRINYKEYKFLRKFITEQGKIIPAHVTGVSAKYQRMITTEIKKARVLALLPFAADPRYN
jgi:small subunit ribosomal protein S18|tara:strand:+ start:188 stop:424 length:237 start_codon:yes stop_codon:yes gene_type:complete